MVGGIVAQELEVLGQFIKSIGDGARTDTGYDGEINIYWDAGNSVVRMQVYSATKGDWQAFDPTEHLTTLYAPIAADYLVGTANATLTGEIVAGTAPGGELSDSADWADLAVNAMHAEGSHSSMIATHAESETAHHSNASDHANTLDHDESHTVESHWDTTGTGTELNTLTDGSNADALHSHAEVGWVVELFDGTEYSHTGDTALTTVKSYTVSIPSTSRVRVRFTLRTSDDNQSRWATDAQIVVNSTTVFAKNSGMWRFLNAVDGITHCEFEVPLRNTAAYLHGGVSGHAQFSDANDTTGPPGDIDWAEEAPWPSTTVTSIALKVQLPASGSVAYVKNMLIETLDLS